jgi:hypothetical protein
VFLVLCAITILGESGPVVNHLLYSFFTVFLANQWKTAWPCPLMAPKKFFTNLYLSK